MWLASHVVHSEPDESSRAQGAEHRRQTRQEDLVRAVVMEKSPFPSQPPLGRERRAKGNNGREGANLEDGLAQVRCADVGDVCETLYRAHLGIYPEAFVEPQEEHRGQRGLGRQSACHISERVSHVPNHAKPAKTGRVQHGTPYRRGDGIMVKVLDMQSCCSVCSSWYQQRVDAATRHKRKRATSQ